MLSFNFAKPGGCLSPRLIFFLIFFSATSYSQTKSNLEIFYQLVESSISNASENINEGTAIIELILPGNYSVFRNQILLGLQKQGVRQENLKQFATGFNYVLENAKVNYGDIFRKSFLGDYFTSRKIFIKGNYLINIYSESNRSLVENPFEIVYEDTIRVDEVQALENSQYSFTKGELPSEPFFASLLEPVVAVAAAAVAVYLFFSVRSK
jgi:hypothetical protein